MSKLDKRPIFVVGAPRSGTTMLQYMLSSHPRIHILHESNFIPRFFQHRPRTPMKRQQAIHVLKAVLGAYRYKHFVREWQGEQLDPAAFVDGLPDLMPATLIDTLFSQYARQFGAERWGDKSPIYTGYIDVLAEIFPRAQFIHLIRDGRDVALSTVSTYEDRLYVDVYYSARNWERRIRKALASAAKLDPSRYYELRYEELTADPESVLRKTCEFLDEVYATEMAEPHRKARKHIRRESLHDPVRKPPTTRSSGRWRKEMSKPDQRLVQAVAGDLLDELGYETVDLGTMSLAERARLSGLQAKYGVLHAGRRALQTLGVFPPN